MSSIISLFPNKTLVDVLNLLLLNPEEEFYQRNLAERTGHALLQVQHALNRIEQAGLLHKRKSGNRIYYKIEKKHPAYQDLKGVFLKTVALRDVLVEKIKPFQERVQFFFVFGSFARGQETAESDIDLCMIGNVSLKEISGIMSSVGQELGREVNPILYSLEDLQEKALDNDHFVRELVASPKIWIIGEQDEFAKVAR